MDSGFLSCFRSLGLLRNRAFSCRSSSEADGEIRAGLTCPCSHGEGRDLDDQVACPGGRSKAAGLSDAHLGTRLQTHPRARVFSRLFPPVCPTMHCEETSLQPTSAAVLAMREIGLGLLSWALGAPDSKPELTKPSVVLPQHGRVEADWLQKRKFLTLTGNGCGARGDAVDSGKR